MFDKKAYSKKWREEHREELANYKKQWNKEHKKERAVYNRKYEEEHKEEVKARGRKYRRKHKEEYNARSRRWYQEHKERVNLTAKRNKRKARMRALKLLGSKCFFCGRVRNLNFHKKDGKPHGKSNVGYLVLKIPEEFVLLCFIPCHKGVHWLMEVFNMKWSEIVKKLEVMDER